MYIQNENKKPVKINVSDKIFCPSYGIGEVLSIEDVNYLETKVKMCKLFFHAEKMNIMIPVSKASEMGIRLITPKDSMMKIINNILTKSAKMNKGVWTKRIIECESKLYSGSVILIAEVVRDLFPGIKDQNKSYSERVLFEKAKNRFVSEVMVSLNIAEEEAHRMVLDCLEISFNKIGTIKNSNLDDLDLNKDNESDDFNDEEEDSMDFEDDEIDNEEEKTSKKKKKTA